MSYKQANISNGKQALNLLFIFGLILQTFHKNNIAAFPESSNRKTTILQSSLVNRRAVPSYPLLLYTVVIIR